MAPIEHSAEILSRYPRVFTPFSIGGVTFRNRIFIPAHTTNFAEQFLPTSRHIAYHRERARGGVGLIIVEPLRVHRTALGRSGGLAGADAGARPGLSAIVDAIHEGGARAFVQITHPGRHSDNFTDRLPPWGPSSVPWTTSGEIPHAMTHREMQEVIDGYVVTVLAAVEVGFDGLEVHFGHGHLLHQFLSPACNVRSDEYGGSLDNRLRFPLAVLQAVTNAVAARIPVGIRVSVDELMNGGLDVEASREIVGRAASVPGVAFVNASVSAYSWPSIGYHVADMSYPPHPFLKETVALREVIGELPLLTANRYTSLKDAEEGLGTGAIDMIGMNRAHMADPNVIRKMLMGEEAAIRPCVSSNFCIGQIALHRPIACMMNPRVGHEEHWEETPDPADTRRKILIVGGGPAGMEAGRIAAARGHDVTLWERNAALGGALVLGGTGVGRRDLHKMQDYLEMALRRTEARITLAKTGSLEDITAFGADVVIVATGADAAPLEVAGGTELLSIEEALERGVTGWTGTTVGIFDASGSWATLTVAESLATWGSDVTLISAPDSPLWDINIYSRMTALDRLRAKGVKIRTAVEIQRIDGNCIELRERMTGATVRHSGFSHFLQATRGRSRYDLPNALEKAGIKTFIIGDALAPRSLLEAMFDGHALGRRV